MAAYVHQDGMPHWGPLRKSVLDARRDRAVLEVAQAQSRLLESLSRLQAGDSSEFDPDPSVGLQAEMPSSAAAEDDMFD